VIFHLAFPPYSTYLGPRIGTCQARETLEFCFRQRTLFVIESWMMRPLRWFFVFCLCLWQCGTHVFAAEYHLTNGDVVQGTAVSFDDDGMIVRLDIGGYSSRIGWSKLTQESLIELAKNPEAAKFVEPFIDTPPTPKEKKPKKDIVIKPVPRVERVAKPNFFASVATPAGIGFFLVLFLGNLYAAYEIARFRNRSPLLVCGVSAIVPVLGPALFLAAPANPEGELAQEALAEPAGAAVVAGKSTTGSLARSKMPASGLSIAHEEKTATAAAQGPQSYKRGEFTLNRRFFETKFPGFFRVVPADPDLVLVVRTPKTEHVAKRITRISSTDVHIQLVRGIEQAVSFAEITEVVVRHKDAK
jgi:hypothetical protein